jgi:predicted CoA-substrate-specific enzyme activase
MIVGGCDVGSATGKAVIMKDGGIAAFAIIPSTTKPEETAYKVMDQALRKIGLSSLEEIEYVVGTGYGRVKIPFAIENVSEISCHSRGAYWLYPTIRTVIDIGGQDSKVIGVGEMGRVREFNMNNKCAAGTGRFFEAMARTLHVDLQEFSFLALRSRNPVSITSQCSVFAESEVISLINDGADPGDIAAGLHLAIASRLSSQVRHVGLVGDVAVTGGCAKNRALVESLEKKLGTDIRIKMLPEDPQIVGALGAALIAAEKLNKQTRAAAASR